MSATATPPAKTESPLLIDERRRLIRELVQSQGRVTVDELADRLPRALQGRLAHARADLGHAGGALRPQLLKAAHARAAAD